MPLSLRRHATLLAILTIAMAVGVIQSTASAALTRVSPYLTRAEAAAILVLANPAPLPDVPDVSPYVDVLPNDWFRPSILAAAKLGILTPNDTGTHLKPFGSVSREAFFTMLSRAFPSSTFEPPPMSEANRLMTQDEARATLEQFLAMRSHDEHANATDTAIAQSTGNVQLYNTISTKRLRVVFVGNTKQQLAAATDPERPGTEHIITRLLTSSRFAPTPAPIRAKTLDEVRADVVTLVNAVRRDAGLQPLAQNDALEHSAQTYADQMEQEGFFGHTDPAGKTLTDRVNAVHYYSTDVSLDCQCVKGYALGENLARGQRSAEEVVQAWINSPSHRDAILGSDFTDIGIGVNAGVWVQHFGGVLVPEKE